MMAHNLFLPALASLFIVGITALAVAGVLRMDDCPDDEPEEKK